MCLLRPSPFYIQINGQTTISRLQPFFFLFSYLYLNYKANVSAAPFVRVKWGSFQLFLAYYEGRQILIVEYLLLL